MNGPSAPRRRFYLALRLLLAGVLLGLILRRTPPAEIGEVLVSASPGLLAAGTALGVAFGLLKVLRWRWLLGRLGVPCSVGRALYSYLGGMALGLTTPGRLGEVGRSLYIAGQDRVLLTGAALVDKVFDVSVIFAVGGVGCAAHGLALPAVGMFVASVVLAAVPASIRRICERVARPLRALDRPTVALAMLQAGVAFLMTALQFHLFLSAFGPAPAGATLFVLPLMILSNLVPLTVSGVGIREWASVLLFRRYGIPAAVAVTVAWLVYLCNSLLPGLAGAVLAPKGFSRVAVSDAREAAR